MNRGIQKLVLALCIFSLSTAVSFAESKKKGSKKNSHAGASAEKTSHKKADKHQDGGPELAKFERSYGTAGCGLGAMVLGKQKGMVQIFAATTNGTLGNQTFGISFGTLNCKLDSTHTAAQKLDQFVSANKVALAMDIAKGNGETLAAVNEITGCNDAAVLSSALQKNFGKIYPSEKAEPMDVTDSIITVIRNNSELKCSKVADDKTA